MAVGFVLKTVSDNQLRYAVTSTGAQTGGLTAATMASNANNGSPLEAILGTPVASQAAAQALAFDNPNLQIQFPSPNRDADAAWIIDADSVGGFLQLNCTSAAPDGTGSYLVITFRHSLTR